MTEKIVTVEIDEQGNSSIDLAGFQGKGCGDVARALQGADAITKSQTKREFYVDVLVRQNQQQKQ
jgi:hypothetical protein